MDDYPYYWDLEHEDQDNRNAQKHVLDKTEEDSIIEETVEQIKQLEQQVQFLEQRVRRNRERGSRDANKCDHGSISSASYSYTISSVSSSSISMINTDISIDNPPLEVKAKILEGEIHVTMHSKMEEHLLPNILQEMENLHLSPLTTNLMPFGDYAVFITIIAKMDDEFCMTVKDLVKHLRQLALQLF